jgi:hypothetical protein
LWALARYALNLRQVIFLQSFRLFPWKF